MTDYSTNFWDVHQGCRALTHSYLHICNKVRELSRYQAEHLKKALLDEAGTEADPVQAHHLSKGALFHASHFCW